MAKSTAIVAASALAAPAPPIALALALPINPSAVLLAVESGAFDVADVCGAPFIEDTVRDVPAYVRKAQTAVAKVADPTLAQTRTACLAALAKAG